jgi:hypothetical protein
VQITDTLCAPVTLVSGDTGGDGVLGLTETWLYTCAYTIPRGGAPDPLLNTVDVSGLDILGGAVTDSAHWSTDLVVGSIGDFVYIDRDQDGTQAITETIGIPYAPVYITGVDANGDPVAITATTTITGFYQVTGLLPGVYTATVDGLFMGHVRTSPASRQATLTLTAPDDATLDFGYALPTGVALMRFAAGLERTALRLEWQVALTDGAAAPRFQVWRTRADGDAWKLLTPTGVDPAAGDGSVFSYVFQDTLTERGATYLYRLQSEEGVFFGPWPARAWSSLLFLPALGR